MRSQTVVETAPDAPRPGRTPPGPAPREGGVIARVRYGLNFLLDPMGFVGGRFQRYGDVYFVDSRDSTKPGLFVMRHPEHLEEVLVTKSKAFRKQHSGFEMLSRVLGDGLLTTDGDVWRRQRRLLQPAFSKKRLDEYASVMASEAVAEAASWRLGEERDVSEAMMEMTLRIVCRTLFGHDSSQYTARVRGAMEAFQSSLLGLELPIPRLLSPTERRLAAAKKTLDEIIFGMIRARQPGDAHDDLLQRLVDATDDDGSRLGEREIRDQLVTLFLAGHETTSNALSWAFHLLSENPDVEAKLHAELDEVLGGRAPTAADLPALHYCDLVFTEAMRLYPPVFMIARKAETDVEIGEWHVPAGSEVVLWVWHTHRDPRWFAEPWAFRPERFEKEASAERPKLAYLPYGAGGRACIGKMFAQMEGVLALAAIASKVRLVSTGGSVELNPRITLAPRGGLPMRIAPR